MIQNIFHRLSVLALLQLILLSTVESCAENLPLELTDKTLVVWCSVATLDQVGGSALTVDTEGVDRFDGVVFAELTPRVWMAGSNNFSRTCKEQEDWSKETAGPDEMLQIAIVYKGREVKMFRNGELYASYEMSDQPNTFGDRTAIVFGRRHLVERADRFLGRIRDARVYDVPLTQETIALMKPGEAIEGVEPWAWWDFASTGTYERTGKFTTVKLAGEAVINDRCLVFSGKGGEMVATLSDLSSGMTAKMPEAWSKSDPVPSAAVESARLLREKMLDDPYRPRWHFAVPDDNGRPGDPNGCFFARGRYHLMYLYNRTGSGFSWGHISSSDLLHWRHHPDAIGPGDGDEGCFSGGGFVDDDGTAYLTYWMLWGDKGLGMAASSDRDYDHWTKFAENPVVRSTEWGITEIEDEQGEKIIYGSADPTNIWKKDGKYYMCGGNLLVLNKYGRAADAPEQFKGDHLYLFESEDLKKWTYKGEFYERRTDNSWTDPSEDNMCPSFLPLPASQDGSVKSDKHLLLFIAHNRGCQAYVGTYDKKKDRFIPETHSRMSWVDNTYFAPEALVDDRGRQIMWAWLTDNPAGGMENGWNGVYGLPRSLWVGEDGTLKMAPVEELKQLRRHPQKWEDVKLTKASATKVLEGVVGDSCELEMTIPAGATASRYGVKVRTSADGSETTLLYYDAAAGELCMDSTASGITGRNRVERAPLKLDHDEPLTLRVFVDRSVVEVYANNRQAICRRVYPGRSDSLGVVLFADDGDAKFVNVNAWEIMPTNPY